MKRKQNKLVETVIFRCEKKLFYTLKRMAKEQGLTISQLVRILLEEKTHDKE
jgi:predicted DNA-binding ribbon-helix-helix protein